MSDCAHDFIWADDEPLAAVCIKCRAVMRLDGPPHVRARLVDFHVYELRQREHAREEAAKKLKAAA